MDQKVYIGIDFGDKTLSIDSANSLEAGNNTTLVSLPGVGFHGDPNVMVTAVGLLKKHGTGKESLQERRERIILADSLKDYELTEFSELYVNFKIRPSTADEKGLANIENGITLLLEKVFSSKITKEALNTLRSQGGKIRYCYGYPTNWDEKDVAALKGILAKVSLPYQEEEVMIERESSAALVALQTDLSKKFQLSPKDCILVLDFGSSTLNVTALNLEAKEPLYNSGDNYFGSRIVDYAILDAILSDFSEINRKVLKDLYQKNGDLPKRLLLLDAGTLKEKYSMKGRFTKSAKLYLNEALGLVDAKVVMSNQQFEQAILLTDVGELLRRHQLAPQTEIARYKGYGYRSYLLKYLREEKRIMEQRGILPNKVIVTGGGSLLYTVQEVCTQVFGEFFTFHSNSAARIISKGLALIAKKKEASLQFEKSVGKMLDEKCMEVIERNLPSLARLISGETADIILDKIVKSRLLEWREGVITTLEDVEDKMYYDCQYKLSSYIMRNKEIQEAVTHWCRYDLGYDIAQELRIICASYGATDFDLETLNVFDETADVLENSAGCMIDSVTHLLAELTASMVETVLRTAVFAGVFIGGILLFTPTVAVAVLGLAWYKMIKQGKVDVKSLIKERIMDMNLPMLSRMLISKDSILTAVDEERGNTILKVEEALNNQSTKEKMGMRIKELLVPQMQKKMQEIIYAIDLDK
jgi:molecular chaperone DnaK (HSP70)